MTMTAQSPIPPHAPSSADVVVVGAGPTGAAAAAHAANRGLDVLLVDAQSFPRDKTCGDGLTPRAIAELERLGLADGVLSRTRNRGLKLHGFGGSITAPWPEGAFPATGSAVPRTIFDAMVVDHAVSRGATLLDGCPVTSVERGLGRSVAAVSVRLHDGAEQRIATRWLLVADGVRSPVGKQLGRTWHRDSVFGVAARSYCSTTREEEWIHSHLELRDEDGAVQPGYGWIFPLGGGRVNLGCGALATSARPAKVNVKKLLHHYAGQVRGEWGLGEPESVTSALLPMGGAVSHVAGPNWALLGDAAALVNPLNGEGIDYALEGGRLLAELICSGPGPASTGTDLTRAWPELLRATYGESFAIARDAAHLLTFPQFLPFAGPIGMRSQTLMTAAVRCMSNTVADSDRDVVARGWRAAGSIARRLDRRPLFAD